MNLSGFNTEDFLKRVFSLLREYHFSTRRNEFVSLFIREFLAQFRSISRVEETEIINDHPIWHYINFSQKELGITTKEELLGKFRRLESDLREIFNSPNTIKPVLSDKGFDAYLILRLIKENSQEHYYSFILCSYLKKHNVSFELQYLNICREITRREFSDHIERLDSSLSKFGSDFHPLRLDNELLTFLAVWWEYYQFAFIGEKVTRNIHGFLQDGYTETEIRKKISKDLDILRQFLTNFNSRGADYVRALSRDANHRQILIQLEEIAAKSDAMFDYLLGKASSQSSGESFPDPFFPSLGSFERWVEELTDRLKLR